MIPIGNNVYPHAAMATTTIPPLTATVTSGVPVNPYWATMGAQQYTVNVPVSYVPTPPCSCRYTGMLSSRGEMTDVVRYPSFDCPQHFPPEPKAASDHTCPTCGR